MPRICVPIFSGVLHSLNNNFAMLKLASIKYSTYREAFTITLLHLNLQISRDSYSYTMELNKAFKTRIKTKYILRLERWAITVILHAKLRKVSLASSNQLYKSTWSINHDLDTCITLPLIICIRVSNLTILVY